MHKIASTPLDFVDAFGGRFVMSAAQYVALMRRSTTQFYLLCVYFVLVASDAPALMGQMSLATAMGVWAIVLGCFILMHGAALVALDVLQRAWRRFLIPNVVVMLLAITPSVFVGDRLVQLTAANDVTVITLQNFFFYLVISELFVLIYHRYVRHSIEVEDLSDAKADAQGSSMSEAERKIVIGTEPVPLARLRHIQAQEHHVHVTLDESRLTHRARLADIVAQTAPEDGIQPHRSWWVAAHATQALKRDGARHVLQLDDGTRVPVARTRLEEVRAWLDQHG